MQPQFLIIGGAEKAGTTSLFGYLAAHPEVCASSRKETDYFRSPVDSLDGYMTFFDRREAAHSLLLEASPGYLAEADAVAPRLGALLPSARLMFVLRDPVDRIQSCFRYYKSRLHVPDAMTLDQFIEWCLLYQSDPASARRSGLADWHLAALQRGRYEDGLAAFRAHVPLEQILLVPYDALASDPQGTMRSIADFTGIDPGYYDAHAFGRENVTFLARRRTVQRIAIAVNDSLEGVWRRQPGLKRTLLRLYKRFNERQMPKESIGETILARLEDYYAPTRTFMHDELAGIAAAKVAAK